MDRMGVEVLLMLNIRAVGLAVVVAMSCGCSESMPEEWKLKDGTGAEVMIPLKVSLYDADTNKQAAFYLESPNLIFMPIFMLNAEPTQSGVFGKNLANPGSWKPTVVHIESATYAGPDCVCFRLLGVAKNGLGVEQQFTSASLECHGEDRERRNESDRTPALMSGHRNDCSQLGK
jgi:hypothetical protein